jgi:DNA-binding winged helix-turn-helix (wHTH) protein
VSVPSAAEFLERVVAALAEPSVDPDFTVGQAVWQLYQTGADAWTALALHPVSGGHEAFDAVYEATRHGLHVLDGQTERRDRLLAASDAADEVPVVFGGEVVAAFRAVRGPRVGREIIAALAGATPGIGILLVELAQRRRMQSEINHLRALARLNASLLDHRDAPSLLEAAAAELRAAWNVERVRIFGHDEGGGWPLLATAALAGSAPSQQTLLAPALAAVAEPARQAVAAAVAPAGWLVPVADGGPPHGAVVLDNALTGKPLERADDLAQAVRGLAAAWARLPHAAPPAVEPVPERPATTAIAEAIGPYDSHLILWRLLGPARRSRRRDRQATEEAGRALERLVPPRYRFLAVGTDSFVALLTGTSLATARELADGALDALASSWRMVGAVVCVRGRPASAVVDQAFELAKAAEALHDGAVLADADRYEVAADGGLVIAEGAVLHPNRYHLDLASGTVALTPTEVRILSALSLAGGPLPAGELVRRVWPGDRTMGVMNLYPHVHGLRRHLIHAWPGGLRVRTIRGQGYTLASEGTVAELV